MPQLDKLLAQVAPRGGKALWLEPGRQPLLRLASGGELALLANTLPASMIELLVNEVLPGELAEAWTSRGEASFDYGAAGETFRLNLMRGPLGPQLLASHGARTAPLAAFSARATTPIPARAPAAGSAQRDGPQ